MSGVGWPLDPAERDRVLAPLDQAWTLPPRAYTAPAAFDAELDAIFHRDWVCVARTEHLPNPGDYRCVTVGRQPVVITRGADGVLRALSNACLHRAMPLAEGSGNARLLVCPYHRWSYAGDGRLVSAPMMDGVADFQPAACRLPEFALEVWEGFVFVALDPGAAPLAPRLEPLRERLADWRLGGLVTATVLDFDSPWNWKLLVENFMEAYHHIGPHQHSFEPHYPAAAATVDDGSEGRDDDAPWALLRMPGRRDVDAGDGLPWLGSLPRERRADMLAAVVFPHMLFAVTGTLAAWYELQVDAHDHFHLRIHVLVEPATLELPHAGLLRDALAEGTRAIHLEDIPVNAGPWKNLHAPHATQGRLAVHEKALWQFNRWWLGRLAGAHRG